MKKKYSDMIEEMVTDSDGAWIYLKNGYQHEGAHTIHEDTMRQAKKRLPEVELCTGKCCTEKGA